MGITPLPQPPSSSDPENFDERADAWYLALPEFTDELNSLGSVLALGQVGTSSNTLTVAEGPISFTLTPGLGVFHGLVGVLTANDNVSAQMLVRVDTYNPTSGATTGTVPTGQTAGTGSHTGWTFGPAPASIGKGSASLIWAGTDDAAYLTAKMLIDSAAYATLTDAPTIAWNVATQGFNAKFVQSAARTVGKPSNLRPNMSGKLKFDCNGFKPAWHSSWEFGDAGPPDPVTTAGKWHFVNYDYDADLDKQIATYFPPA